LWKKTWLSSIIIKIQSEFSQKIKFFVTACSKCKYEVNMISVFVEPHHPELIFGLTKINKGKDFETPFYIFSERC